MMSQRAQFLTPRCKSPLIIAIQLQATFFPEPLSCCHFSFYKSIIFTNFSCFMKIYYYNYFQGKAHPMTCLGRQRGDSEV